MSRVCCVVCSPRHRIRSKRNPIQLTFDEQVWNQQGNKVTNREGVKLAVKQRFVAGAYRVTVRLLWKWVQRWMKLSEASIQRLLKILNLYKKLLLRVLKVETSCFCSVFVLFYSVCVWTSSKTKEKKRRKNRFLWSSTWWPETPW